MFDLNPISGPSAFRLPGKVASFRPDGLATVSWALGKAALSSLPLWRRSLELLRSPQKDLGGTWWGPGGDKLHQVLLLVLKKQCCGLAVW